MVFSLNIFSNYSFKIYLCKCYSLLLLQGMTLKMTKSILNNEQQSHPSFHVTFDLGCTEDSKIMISDE